MGFSFKQAAVTQAAASTKATPFASNVTQGDLLIALAVWNHLQTFVSIADTQNLTWTQIGSEVDNGVDKFRAYWAVAASTGAETVTFTISGIIAPTAKTSRSGGDFREAGREP